MMFLLLLHGIFSSIGIGYYVWKGTNNVDLGIAAGMAVMLLMVCVRVVISEIRAIGR